MTEDSPFFSTSAPVHTSPKRERGICELDRGLPLHPRLRFGLVCRKAQLQNLRFGLVCRKAQLQNLRFGLA